MLTAASWLLNLWFGESWVLSRSRCWEKLGSKDRNAPYIIQDIVWNTVLAYQQKIIHTYIYICIHLLSNVSCSRCTSLWCWLDISHITFSWFITGERIRIISSIAVEVRGRTILRERWVLELWIHFFRWRSETLRCCGHKRSAECYKSVGGSICFREAGTFWNW